MRLVVRAFCYGIVRIISFNDETQVCVSTPPVSHFARLLHLVDSAIPTGSFAYSYGLESSIAFGLVNTPIALRN
ncbi:MAG: hypothetical protein JWP58_2763 [Hymenobacter sp.]|nr:hypothetical protein [Hymenobacter sp.]